MYSLKANLVAFGVVVFTAAGHRTSGWVYFVRPSRKIPSSKAVKQTHEADTCGHMQVSACRRKEVRSCLTGLGSGRGRVPQWWWRVRAVLIINGYIWPWCRLPWQRAYIRTTVARLSRLLPGQCNNGAAALQELTPMHHLQVNIETCRDCLGFIQPCTTHSHATYACLHYIK